MTQENIMKTIAEQENISIALVRKIFKSTEKIVFDCLSSTSPEHDTCIKLFDGLSLECKYIPERQLHTYDDIKCNARIWAKPKITRYYNRKLNGYFAERR